MLPLPQPAPGHCTCPAPAAGSRVCPGLGFPSPPSCPPPAGPRSQPQSQYVTSSCLSSHLGSVDESSDGPSLSRTSTPELCQGSANSRSFPLDPWGSLCPGDGEPPPGPGWPGSWALLGPSSGEAALRGQPCSALGKDTSLSCFPGSKQGPGFQRQGQGKHSPRSSQHAGVESSGAEQGLRPAAITKGLLPEQATPAPQNSLLSSRRWVRAATRDHVGEGGREASAARVSRSPGPLPTGSTWTEAPGLSSREAKSRPVRSRSWGGSWAPEGRQEGGGHGVSQLSHQHRCGRCLWGGQEQSQ